EASSAASPSAEQPAAAGRSRRGMNSRDTEGMPGLSDSGDSFGQPEAYRHFTGARTVLRPRLGYTRRADGKCVRNADSDVAPRQRGLSGRDTGLGAAEGRWAPPPR